MCNTGLCEHEQTGDNHCSQYDEPPCLTEDTIEDQAVSQPEKADRYTVITIQAETVVPTIEACRELGLYWFARNDVVTFSKHISFYVFFDRAGMRNYLRGHYEPLDDDG